MLYRQCQNEYVVKQEVIMHISPIYFTISTCCTYYHEELIPFDCLFYLVMSYLGSKAMGYAKEVISFSPYIKIKQQ